MNLIKNELLEKMSTQRLLQVLKKHRTSIIHLSRSSEESDNKYAIEIEDQQKKIKEILKNREHLERKK